MTTAAEPGGSILSDRTGGTGYDVENSHEFPGPYTPAHADPSSGRPWWKKKRYLVPAGTLSLIMIAGALADPDDRESDETVIAAPGDESASLFYQPEVEATGDDGPFWQTTFGVVVPSGHWEPVETDLAEGFCRPIPPAQRPWHRGRRL